MKMVVVAKLKARMSSMETKSGSSSIASTPAKLSSSIPFFHIQLCWGQLTARVLTESPSIHREVHTSQARRSSAASRLRPALFRLHLPEAGHSLRSSIQQGVHLFIRHTSQVRTTVQVETALRWTQLETHTSLESARESSSR